MLDVKTASKASLVLLQSLLLKTEYETQKSILYSKVETLLPHRLIDLFELDLEDEVQILYGCYMAC